MDNFWKGLGKTLESFLELISILPRLLRDGRFFYDGLCRAVRRCFRRPPRRGCCVELPPGVYVRPDPMIYDQYYLMAQGLAVTWDNPDIQLFDMAGNPVSPDGLVPDRDYRVQVRVWNNSFDAPAPGLPVYLSFLSFGIGITSTPVGAATTDLGVKGSAHCPAFADFVWHTPATPGHYCLQALLVWPDDANPNNNLGQKNTQVGKLQSPAQFTVGVENRATVRRHFELEADMYQFPPLPPCSEQPPPSAEGRYAESKARWAAALRTQAYGLFPVTPEWNVTITPTIFDLDPGQVSSVTVAIEPASGAFRGSQPFNIHGFASPPAGPRKLVGGVTLTVQAS